MDVQQTLQLKLSTSGRYLDRAFARKRVPVVRILIQPSSDSISGGPDSAHDHVVTKPSLEITAFLSMGLSFRTARKLWMGVIAVLSLVCISLAALLWVNGSSKSNNFGALIAIPCFAFIGAVWSILKKRFFSPQIVCVEATWVFALLPFQILLGLFAFESKTALHTHSTAVYEALVALVWMNVVLVFVYAAGIILLGILTQLSFDQNVWARDIDSSPSPFPFPILIVHAFPWTARYFDGTGAESEAFQAASTEYCLPGCTCCPKPTYGSDLESQDGAGGQTIASTNSVGSSRSTIPIRVPTAMDRRNIIHVTLAHLSR